MGTRDNSIFERNRQMITGYAHINQDGISRVDDVINELIDAGVGAIREVTVVEGDTWNWELLLTDDKDRVYYLEISEDAYIVELRKDNPEGELVLALLRDDIAEE